MLVFTVWKCFFLIVPTKAGHSDQKYKKKLIINGKKSTDMNWRVCSRFTGHARPKISYSQLQFASVL